MTATLSVRLPAAEKKKLFEVAARESRSANELVRDAIRKELSSRQGGSPLVEFFRSVDASPPAPTNAAVRAAMRGKRR